MFRFASGWGGFAAAWVWAGAVCSSMGGEPDGLPRYARHPGQVLTYRQSSEFQYDTGHDKGVMADSAEIRFRVIRRNEDGSWRILFDARERSKTIRESDKSAQKFLKDFASKFLSRVKPEAVADENVTFKLAAFDLFPDGRVVIADSVDLIRNDPTAWLALLPASHGEIATGWTQASSGPSGHRVSYRLISQTRNEWVIIADYERFMDKVYQSSMRHRFYFDLDRGLIRRIETEDAMDYTWHGRGHGTVELVSVSTLAPEPLAQLTREMDWYLEARDRSLQLLLQASDDANLTEKRLDEAEAILKQAQSRITLADFAEPIAKAIKDNQGSRSYSLEEAKRKAEVIGQPAAEWELKDLADKTHSLVGYRGQVIVLDFWYRGCGWCVRAMPQMKQLADDFRGQPVAILGMNKDHDVKDAQFVADAMGLNYPTLKAEGIAEKYQVQVFPTLIIIDPHGKIADFHVGYSPQLRREVGEKIRRLLADSPQAN